MDIPPTIDCFDQNVSHDCSSGDRIRDVADVIRGSISLPMVDPISVVREKRRDIVSSVFIFVSVLLVVMDI